MLLLDEVLCHRFKTFLYFFVVQIGLQFVNVYFEVFEGLGHPFEEQGLFTGLESHFGQLMDRLDQVKLLLVHRDGDLLDSITVLICRVNELLQLLKPLLACLLLADLILCFLILDEAILKEDFADVIETGDARLQSIVFVKVALHISSKLDVV